MQEEAAVYQEEELEIKEITIEQEAITMDSMESVTMATMMLIWAFRRAGGNGRNNDNEQRGGNGQDDKRTDIWTLTFEGKLPR